MDGVNLSQRTIAARDSWRPLLRQQRVESPVRARANRSKLLHWLPRGPSPRALDARAGRPRPFLYRRTALAAKSLAFLTADQSRRLELQFLPMHGCRNAAGLSE